MLIGHELDARNIATPAAIGTALGMPAAKATSLLTRRQWREGYVARLKAAAARRGGASTGPMTAETEAGGSMPGGGDRLVWVITQRVVSSVGGAARLFLGEPGGPGWHWERHDVVNAVRLVLTQRLRITAGVDQCQIRPSRAGRRQGGNPNHGPPSDGWGSWATPTVQPVRESEGPRPETRRNGTSR